MCWLKQRRHPGQFRQPALAVTWNRGSNEYTADVPSVLTEQPGQYTLVVSVVSGRDSASSNTTTSVLLSRTIEVTQAANVETIITGAVAGALLLN